MSIFCLIFRSASCVILLMLIHRNRSIDMASKLIMGMFAAMMQCLSDSKM